MSGAASYADKKARAILEWNKLDDNGRAKFYEEALRAGWSGKAKGAPRGNQNAKEAGGRTEMHLGHGVLVDLAPRAA